MNVPSIEVEMRGLSFAARAVLATATALTYEMQEPEIPVRKLKQLLDLSDDAWECIYAELYEQGSLFRVRDRYLPAIDLVQVMDSFAILANALGAGGRPSAKDWAELRIRVFAERGEQCHYCGAEGVPLEVDHIIPVTGGGSNHITNLVPACKPCNSAKGNKSWEEWYPIMQRARACRSPG